MCAVDSEAGHIRLIGRSPSDVFLLFLDNDGSASVAFATCQLTVELYMAELGGRHHAALPARHLVPSQIANCFPSSAPLQVDEGSPEDDGLTGLFDLTGLFLYTHSILNPTVNLATKTYLTFCRA